MSDDRKCSKPGCGALSILGKACLDRDCPQTWVHYTAYNAEIERLTASRDGYVKQRNALQEECDRLRAALVEERKRALEEAAAYHDGQAEKIAQIAKQNTHNKDLWDKLAKDVFAHQRHAAAIRSLMEKPE